MWFWCLDKWDVAYITQFNSFKVNRDKGAADSLQRGSLCCGQRERIPVGQTDSFDGVVAVIYFVAGFKHNTEPPTAEALHRLKVS